MVKRSKLNIELWVDGKMRKKVRDIDPNLAYEEVEKLRKLVKKKQDYEIFFVWVPIIL